MLNLPAQLKRSRILLLCVLVPALMLGMGTGGALLLCSKFIFLAALWTAGALCALYLYGQRIALPLLRVWRLYERLAQEEPEEIFGVVLGWREGKNSREGVLMRRLILDTGEKVRGQDAPREVSVPAVLLPRVQAGATLRLTARESIALTLSPCDDCRVKPQEGRYAASALVVGGLILCSAVGWASGHALYARAKQGPTVSVAVCTPAHWADAETDIQEAFAEKGLSRPVFSYTNTLDLETVYQYLATYGALEADCLLLPEETFAAVFDGDVPAFPAELFPEEGLRFLSNGAGEPMALILYDPEDEAYSARFRRLIDWVAVPREDRYILALAPHGVGRGETAIRGLADWLMTVPFSKE